MIPEEGAKHCLFFSLFTCPIKTWTGTQQTLNVLTIALLRFMFIYLYSSCTVYNNDENIYWFLLNYLFYTPSIHRV